MGFCFLKEENLGSACFRYGEYMSAGWDWEQQGRVMDASPCNTAS